VSKILIKGFEKTSLVDWPPYCVSVVFTPYCNFRCEFCHNWQLVLDPDSLPTIPESTVFDFLRQKKDWIDGVCITGGEPLLQPDLIEFAKKLKSLGFPVKLDTNGSLPDKLKEAINSGVIDYVAMDVKAPPKKYIELCKTKAADPNIIKESIELIKNSPVDYEFRTTVLPGFTEKDIKEICEFIGRAKRYCLQQFIPRDTLVGTKFLNATPLPKEKLKQFSLIATPYFKEVIVR